MRHNNTCVRKRWKRSDTCPVLLVVLCTVVLTRLLVHRQSPNGKEWIITETGFQHLIRILPIVDQSRQRCFVNEFEEFVRVRNQSVVEIESNAVCII